MTTDLSGISIQTGTAIGTILAFEVMLILRGFCESRLASLYGRFWRKVDVRREADVSQVPISRECNPDEQAELAPSTVKRWSPVVDRLIAHLGHDDAATIARADIVAWKDALLDAGMSNVTVRDVYVAAVKAMLQFAVDQGRLTQNPAKEVKVRVRKALEERDKAFDGREAGTHPVGDAAQAFGQDQRRDEDKRRRHALRAIREAYEREGIEFIFPSETSGQGVRMMGGNRNRS